MKNSAHKITGRIKKEYLMWYSLSVRLPDDKELGARVDVLENLLVSVGGFNEDELWDFGQEIRDKYLNINDKTNK